MRMWDRLLNAGADKISINSSAIRNPQLIDDIAALRFAGLRACRCQNDWKMVKMLPNGGRIEQIKNCRHGPKSSERGAGEILYQHES